MLEIAVDRIKAETRAMRQDTITIRQELKEITRILEERGRHQDDHHLEDSVASINENRKKQGEDNGGRGSGRPQSTLN